MKVSPKTIAEAIYAGAHNKEGQDLSVFLEDTVSFLNKNRMMGKYKEVLEHLQNLIDKKEKRVRVSVTTAEKLSHKMLTELSDNLKHRYKAEEIEIDEHEDPSLIAGVKIRAYDEVIDMTLSNKLHQLKTHLTKN
ncbi:MAG: F0F1 ATP synthase subunit delta [Candidatus Nomurabacteria bacterium]|nr:F0F1 ATP synthase subunit delta [Candidatus Nomurabacteria bacterium]